LSEPGLEFPIGFPSLIAGLLLTVVPISLAGLFGITKSDASLEQTIGGHFRKMAESVAAATSQFIHERVTDVGQIAADAAIIDAVVASNRGAAGRSEARIAEIDRIWPTPAAAPLVKDLLASPASRSLRRHQALDPRILRITVTDERGATVAATHKTVDYFQADEEYWQDIYAQGRGAISVTDILYDDATKSNYIGVGVPVMEEGTNRFIGTVDALIDLSSLFPVVNQVQVGSTGRTLLVKDDGTVIAGPRADLSMKVKSPEFAAADETLASLAARADGYVVTELKGAGRTLVGFADTGLKRDYGNLGWAVLVCQETRHAFASTRFVGRLIALVSLMGLAVVTLVGMYFTLHRRVPLIEIGELRREPQSGAAAAKSI
jgi:hypothetical protein